MGVAFYPILGHLYALLGRAGGLSFTAILLAICSKNAQSANSTDGSDMRGIVRSNFRCSGRSRIRLCGAGQRPGADQPVANRPFLACRSECDWLRGLSQITR